MLALALFQVRPLPPLLFLPPLSLFLRAKNKKSAVFLSPRCSVCNVNLPDVYYEDAGLPFCKQHFYEYFAHKCQRCNDYITGPTFVSIRLPPAHSQRTHTMHARHTLQRTHNAQIMYVYATIHTHTRTHASTQTLQMHRAHLYAHAIRSTHAPNV